LGQACGFDNEALVAYVQEVDIVLSELQNQEAYKSKYDEIGKSKVDFKKNQKEIKTLTSDQYDANYNRLLEEKSIIEQRIQTLEASLIDIINARSFYFAQKILQPFTFEELGDVVFEVHGYEPGRVLSAEQIEKLVIASLQPGKYPPAVGYQTNIPYQGQTFSDCTEHTMRLFINHLLYNARTKAWDFNRLKNVTHKEPLKELVDFYSNNSDVFIVGGLATHAAWAQLVSNRPLLSYNWAIGVSGRHAGKGYIKIPQGFDESLRDQLSQYFTKQGYTVVDDSVVLYELLPTMRNTIILSNELFGLQLFDYDQQFVDEFTGPTFIKDYLTIVFAPFGKVVLNNNEISLEEIDKKDERLETVLITITLNESGALDPELPPYAVTMKLDLYQHSALIVNVQDDNNIPFLRDFSLDGTHPLVMSILLSPEQSERAYGKVLYSDDKASFLYSREIFSRLLCLLSIPLSGITTLNRLFRTIENYHALAHARIVMTAWRMEVGSSCDKDTCNLQKLNWYKTVMKNPLLMNEIKDEAIGFAASLREEIMRHSSFATNPHLRLRFAWLEFYDFMFANGFPVENDIATIVSNPQVFVISGDERYFNPLVEKFLEKTEFILEKVESILNKVDSENLEAELLQSLKLLEALFKANQGDVAAVQKLFERIDGKISALKGDNIPFSKVPLIKMRILQLLVRYNYAKAFERADSYARSYITRRNKDFAGLDIVALELFEELFKKKQGFASASTCYVRPLPATIRLKLLNHLIKYYRTEKHLSYAPGEIKKIFDNVIKGLFVDNEEQKIAFELLITCLRIFSLYKDPKKSEAFSNQFHTLAHNYLTFLFEQAAESGDYRMAFDMLSLYKNFISKELLLFYLNIVKRLNDSKLKLNVDVFNFYNEVIEVLDIVMNEKKNKAISIENNDILIIVGDLLFIFFRQESIRDHLIVGLRKLLDNDRLNLSLKNKLQRFLPENQGNK